MHCLSLLSRKEVWNGVGWRSPMAATHSTVLWYGLSEADETAEPVLILAAIKISPTSQLVKSQQKQLNSAMIIVVK